MSAAMLRAADRPQASAALADIRVRLGRSASHVLHWRNFNQEHRLVAAQQIGAMRWLGLSSVVVCKRHLSSTQLDEDRAYLYTFRYLLERLSWFARDAGYDLEYTLAHIVRFKLAKLREYEAKLRELPGCSVCWRVIPEGGKIDQPSRIEYLQLADMAASATFNAFEIGASGTCDRRYLEAIAPRLYRRRNAPLTSYGLKMHPWSDSTKAAYPWVAAL